LALVLWPSLAEPPRASFGGHKSLLSPVYMIQQSWSCLVLLTHEIVQAFCFALVSAGSSKAARIAMIAITTSNSISVKPAPPRNRARAALALRCRKSAMNYSLLDLGKRVNCFALHCFAWHLVWVGPLNGTVSLFTGQSAAAPAAAVATPSP